MGTFPVRPHGSAHARNVPLSLLRVTIPNDPSFLPSLFYEGRRTHVRQSVVHTRRREKERGGLSMPIITRMGEGQS